jgi:hypothetical protein
MNRSYVQLTPNGAYNDAVPAGAGEGGAGAGAAGTADGSAKQITDHVNWDRYLSLIQGEGALLVAALFYYYYYY